MMNEHKIPLRIMKFTSVELWLDYVNEWIFDVNKYLKF
jgi:hypothetical protein